MIPRYELAIAAVCTLSARPRLCNQAKLAAALGVPARHLEPALQRLVHAGILKAVRGAAGGYSIARPSSGITFDDVLVAVDDAYEQRRTRAGEQAVHDHIRAAMKHFTIDAATRSGWPA
ncbi:MAG: Rrf2 family transcriptional regulator [Alphaproteobacteria bacterium]|nr:MAG: Rrf2 family transcriptional regulator [Alphaproteobacteria bacterium]